MTDEIRGLARLRIHAGRVEEFAQIAAEVINKVRADEVGTLEYDIYLADDGSECIFVERYADEAAFMAHNAGLGELLGRMLATGSITAEILGDASQELRAALEGMPIRYYRPLLKL